MRVAMLITNGCGPDVRVQKEAHTLALAGCRVAVIAWDRECCFPRHSVEPTPPALDTAFSSIQFDKAGENAFFQVVPEAGSVAITRHHLPAGYRTGRPLLWKIPRFWEWAWQELRRFRPDVVHAHDLDTLPLAYLYGRWSGARVVYDAREYYPGMVRASVGETFSRGLEALDRWLAPRVDAIITVGERLAARYRALGGQVWIVHNSQPRHDAPEITTEAAALRQKLGVPEGALLVVYVGYLTPDRLLAPLLDAVPHLENIWLAVGGTGPLLDQVQAAAARCTRIKALGWVPLDQVPAAVRASDVVYYGLNEQNPNSFYFMPNLAFFALAAGRPLLVTPVGEIAEMVRREKCGIVLDAVTDGAVEGALKQLCDSAYRATLANRAQVMGQTHYTWSYAASQLLRAYGWDANVKNCQ